MAHPLALLAALSTALAAQAQLPPAVELRVPKPPTIATSDGTSFLAYELHVTNLTAVPLTLRRVEVVRSDSIGHALLALEDSALARTLARPGVAPAPAPAARALLGGGLRAVAFLWIPVGAGRPPAGVRHRVTLAVGDGDSVRPHVLEGAAVPVAHDVAVIGPPLRGGGWITGNGPAPATGHRRALIAIDGSPAIAQRFAIDYVQMDEQGRRFIGDSLKNESYHAQGEEALAVADGVVASVKDGISENVPGPMSRAVPITLETVGGNYVILDIGDGRYAFYAHLQPGSLRVRPGDRVRRGQVLGLVGNSGNSTEPHLHLHLSDGPSPLGSEGIPYAHEAFEITGRCRLPLAECAGVVPETRRGELPPGNVVVRFPEGRAAVGHAVPTVAHRVLDVRPRALAAVLARIVRRTSHDPPEPEPTSMPTDDLTIRRVETLAEYQECVAIQEETWGPGFRELVPPAILMASQKIGGVCAAAFTPRGRMLGFVFGMTGVSGGVLVHWSDLLAVRAEARGARIGERLKRHQRELARAIGVRTMYWTFDPLVARNAHLNLVRLGARAVEYVPNMYGDNTGSPLHGALATDRFVAAWDLVSGERSAPGPRRAGVLVNPVTAEGAPVLVALSDAPVVRIAVPRDLDALSAEQRARWRAVTREAFLTYLGCGYEVVGFRRNEGEERPSYELAPAAAVRATTDGRS
jgi:predicted GNAT superfamily acetyltransferase